MEKSGGNKLFEKKRGYKRLHRVGVVCIAGVLINLIGSYIAAKTNCPLYLDSIGTVLSAVMSGTLPGIAVGFITNILKSFSDYASIYYGAINVLIAITASWLNSRGFLKKPWKILVFILALALIGGGLGSVLTWFLFGFATEGISVTLATFIHDHTFFGEFMSQITADYLIDVADKLVTTAVTVLALKVVPQRYQSRLRYEGWQQKPLSAEMKKASDKIGSRKVSLRLKLLLLLTLASFLVGLVATMIGYILFTDSTKQDHKKLAQGVAQLAASMIDGDKVYRYIANGEEADGYLQTEAKLYQIRDSSPDILYIYVYMIRNDGCHVVFDLDTDEMPGSEPGEIIPFDEGFTEEIPLLLAGKEIEPKETDDQFGWLLSAYAPVYNSYGDCVCYAAADVSMNQLRDDSHAFLAKQISLFSGFFILVLAVGLWLAEYGIIYPVNSMALKAGEFAFGDDDNNDAPLREIQELDIHTGDEIENLYGAFAKLTMDSANYLNAVKEKNQTIYDMQNGLIVVLADLVESRDKCTGDHIRKTAAYARIILNELVKEGKFSDEINKEFIEKVVHAAPLHDVGKIKVADAILNKAGKLDDDEYMQMKKHSSAGSDIIDQAMENVPDPDYLAEAKKLARYHHERWDGRGYPDGLKGEEIPLSARVMAVADVFDALVSRRSYKEPFTFERAMEIIREGMGTQFDPVVAQAFINASDEVRKTAEQHRKETEKR